MQELIAGLRTCGIGLQQVNAFSRMRHIVVQEVSVLSSGRRILVQEVIAALRTCGIALQEMNAVS